MKVHSQAERGRGGGSQPFTEPQQNTPLRLRCCLLSFPIGPHNLLYNTSKFSMKIGKKRGEKPPEGLVIGARAALKGSGGGEPRGWGRREWDKVAGLIKSV